MRPRSSRRVDVDGFDALVEFSFGDGNNACCWRRSLDGDFAAVAGALAKDADDANEDDGVIDVDAAALAALDLDAAGRAAVAVIVDDLSRLTALGRAPVLSCIRRYPRDERGLAIATHVTSFHADRAPVAVDTWLYTYAGAPSVGLDNDAARRLVDDPALRAALLRDYGGKDDDGFAAFIEDGSFDLHYGVVDAGGVFSFGTGHLWKIAVQWPGCPVPPCLHRAPDTGIDDPPRLLLIC